MNVLLVGLLSGALLAPPDTAAATAPRALVLEVRGGLSIGAVESSGSAYEVLPGGAWRVSAAGSLWRFVSLYLGYGRAAFGCEDGMCKGRGVEFSTAGLDAGVQLQTGRLWSRAGVVRHRLSASWMAEEARTATARPAVGLEVAAGATLPLPGGIALAPGLRWTASSARFPGDPAADRIRSLTGDVGLRYRVR